jgi:hypothetical protein
MYLGAKNAHGTAYSMACGMPTGVRQSEVLLQTCYLDDVMAVNRSCSEYQLVENRSDDQWYVC